MTHDIFIRAHTVTPEKQASKPLQLGKWPENILVFDTETTIDAQQKLNFGVYRYGRLENHQYICAEEGIFYSDDVGKQEQQVLESYVRNNYADIETRSFPPKLKLRLLSRSLFVEKVFWKAVQNNHMIVGFNLPFDLSRIVVDWRASRKEGWSLILSLRRSCKTGEMEPNPNRPRIRIVSKDSKSAFISLTRTEHPEEWPVGRFLDLHTLGRSLFAESCTLDNLYKMLFGTTGKLAHEPSGKISDSEIDYCRNDVRITLQVLNALKHEFDKHPIDLLPDRAYSPASIAKAYLDAMGIIPPKKKFNVPDRLLGIAMQSYYGGRAECRIRHVSVPIVHTDFTSQYPTVNVLLGNFEVITAEKLSFENVTDDVRELLNGFTPDNAFDPNFWKKLKFFALVLPEDDILPVRAVYGKQTQNIGINRLTSDVPIWFAGPDLIASILLRGKIPHIKSAIRIVPEGKQKGLKTTNLREMIAIDPRKDDFFQCVVEQRQLYKSDRPLSRFLKILANSGSYGLFVEITPEKTKKAATIKIFSGEESFEVRSPITEHSGKWYFPLLGTLITAGGRLLLAMLECSVRDAGGTYLFCDTDSLCIVASENGGLVPCEGGENSLDGQQAVKALSWGEVRSVTKKFQKLNPYNSAAVPEILKIEDVNFDEERKQRELFGNAFAAKRYSIYQISEDGIIIIDPKAHGLGYLYPPKKTENNSSDWTFEAWDWILRGMHGLPRIKPAWYNLPAMMKIVLSTPYVSSRLKDWPRPYNFVFCPIINKVIGYPIGADTENFTLVAPFTSKREAWWGLNCVNVYDGKTYKMALEHSPKLDTVIAQTFGDILQLYPRRPEYKSLAPDGSACNANTCGLLQRASVQAGKLRYIGKETDRRWEEGEDLSLLGFQPMEYESNLIPADENLLTDIRKYGLRELMRRTKLSQHTIEKIRNGQPVRRKTLQRIMLD